MPETMLAEVSVNDLFTSSKLNGEALKKLDVNGLRGLQRILLGMVGLIEKGIAKKRPRDQTVLIQIDPNMHIKVAVSEGERDNEDFETACIARMLHQIENDPEIMIPLKNGVPVTLEEFEEPWPYPGED